MTEKHVSEITAMIRLAKISSPKESKRFYFNPEFRIFRANTSEPFWRAFCEFYSPEGLTPQLKQFVGYGETIEQALSEVKDEVAKWASKINS